MAWGQCGNLTWSTSIPFGTIRNNFWFRTSLIRQPSHLQTFKLDQLRLTLDSSSKILCSPQYLLPPETVIRQKRCFRFKKKAQVIRSLCTSSAILGIYWFMHWIIQPLARQTVWPLCARFSISSSPLLAKTNTPFTPAKHVLLNWFSLNENYKQRTEKLDFPLDSSTC